MRSVAAAPRISSLRGVVRSLTINSNSLSGTFPESMGAWLSLTHLDARSNLFTGGLPGPESGGYPRLEALYLYPNPRMASNFLFDLRSLPSLRYVPRMP